jgi:predicted nucleic acid-binding protein
VIYFDTSALIKRFVAEKGTALVQRVMAKESLVATATVAYAEIYAGLTRKYRDDHLSRAEYTLVCKKFERDWPAYIRVELRDEILQLSRELIQRHPLRGFDAIHLASALSLKTNLDGDVTFAAADERLLRAASAEDLEVLDVETTGGSS